jgi:hypothetical protein
LGSSLLGSARHASIAVDRIRIAEVSYWRTPISPGTIKPWIARESTVNPQGILRSACKVGLSETSPDGKCAGRVMTAAPLAGTSLHTSRQEQQPCCYPGSVPGPMPFADLKTKAGGITNLSHSLGCQPSSSRIRGMLQASTTSFKLNAVYS